MITIKENGLKIEAKESRRVLVAPRENILIRLLNEYGYKNFAVVCSGDVVTLTFLFERDQKLADVISEIENAWLIISDKIDEIYDLAMTLKNIQ